VGDSAGGKIFGRMPAQIREFIMALYRRGVRRSGFVRRGIRYRTFKGRKLLKEILSEIEKS